MTEILIRQARTAREIRREETKLLESKPRPATRLPGSWVGDFAAQRKLVLLCDDCDRKWSPRRHGYRLKDELAVYMGFGTRCDGCRSTGWKVKAWVAEEWFGAIGREAPRRGRWGLNRFGRPKVWF